MAFDMRSVGWSPLSLDSRDYEGLHFTLREVNGTDRLVAQAWMKGLDVIWGAEEFYNDAFCAWARAAEVPTVAHCNPEFYRYEREPGLPRPNCVVVPTSWRIEQMPGAIVMPTPINRERLAFQQRPRGPGPLTFLHVIGLPAVGDRNGTKTVIDALPHVRRRCRMILRSQKNIPLKSGHYGPVEVVVDSQDRADYWTLYEDADVLLMPRRYGGQSLPLQEAMSCGLPVLATDIEPQRAWLAAELRVPVVSDGRIDSKAGSIAMYSAKPTELAAAMDRLTDNLDLVAELSKQADTWAEARSWTRLLRPWRALLADVAHGRVPAGICTEPATQAAVGS
jgi:glycosyltransferase involved in cell wall biosynthesis